NARDAIHGEGIVRIASGNVSLDADAAAALGGHAGDFVCLSVIDSGTGMSPETAAKAAEPFFTTKGLGKGTGLGLVSVVRFARESGGFFALSSAMGAGTSARIYLPRASGKGPQPASTAGGHAVVRGKSEVILVVEDDYYIREIVVQQFKSLGYVVRESASGSAAVELLKTGEPIALVFSDVVLDHGMNGHALAAWISANRPDVKVVLTTGYDPGGDGTDRTSPGLPVVPKPYSLEVVSRVLSEALHGPRNTQSGKADA
ncbi:MAG: response regulator, partial [Rhodospirillaceae bacterium]